MDHATFLYDGDCAFCSACARFAERWVPTPARMLPWQFADLDALGVTVEECDAAVQWIAPGDAVASGPDAIAGLLRTSRPEHASRAGARLAAPLWRVAGAILGVRPVRTLAWPAYRWVARNRHRMPGGTPTCSLPQSERP